MTHKMIGCLWMLFAAPMALANTPHSETQTPAALATPAARPLADTDLADQRGGDALVLGLQTLSAVTNGSITGDYSAGAITISDNAFADFNGIGSVVINTGAQVNLQSALNLTINLAQ